MKKIIFVNSITAVRIIGSVALIFASPFCFGFYVIYALCGVSDMLDGFCARKMQAESKCGEMFDTIADCVFFVVCASVVIANFNIALTIWILIVLSACVKILCLVVEKCKFKKILPHTTLSKILGGVLFASLFFVNIVNINILLGFVCAFAMCINLFSICFEKTKKTLDSPLRE